MLDITYVVSGRVRKMRWEMMMMVVNHKIRLECIAMLQSRKNFYTLECTGSAFLDAARGVVKLSYTLRI